MVPKQLMDLSRRKRHERVACGSGLTMESPDSMCHSDLFSSGKSKSSKRTKSNVAVEMTPQELQKRKKRWQARWVYLKATTGVVLLWNEMRTGRVVCDRGRCDTSLTERLTAQGSANGS